MALSSYRSRADLHARLVQSFAAHEEVYAMYVFGREAEGDVDEFSDIDLIVCSNDLAKTQEHYLATFNAVSPVLATYHIIPGTERELAQMVILRDYSPYQKIDFSITDRADRKGFAPLKCLYKNNDACDTSDTNLQIGGGRDSLANHLNDVLFSIPRFTKCLFRRDRDMYRRWTGICEQLSVLLYEHYFGWANSWTYRLTPPQYKAIHQALTPEHAERLDAIQPLASSPHLPTSFRLAVQFIIELYEAKASATGDRIDKGFADYMAGFLSDELCRHTC